MAIELVSPESSMPIGTIVSSSLQTAPIGFLVCDGSSISRTTYAILFTTIGTTYGAGNGSTTFNIPDLRGAVPRGTGTSSGYTQNITVTLGTKQNDAFGSHNHGGGSHSHTYNDNEMTSYASPLVTGGSWGPINATYNTSNSGIIISTQGENETRMKNIGVNFFIKF
jgi:microcystin-dependent protein